MTGVDVDLFRILEEDLWRNDPGSRDRILDEEFQEFCRFGHVYEREHLLAPTPADLSVVFPFDDFKAEGLADDVVLVTYKSTVTNKGVTQSARRSSLWVNRDGAWRLRFQQATTLPE